MRVCLMNDNFYRSSGVAIAMRRIAAALTNVDCIFAGCKDDGLVEDLSWIPEGRYSRFDLKTSNPLRLVAELLRLKRWLEVQSCHFVHCFHRRLAVLLQLAGIPVLYTAQLAFSNALWFRWLHPRKMTGITPSVLQNLYETTSRRALACISNPAVFPEQVPLIPMRTVQSRAVCVARLEAVKGHTYLLSAWKMLREKGYQFELHLVGEGSLGRALELQAKRDGIDDLIHFRGFTNNVSSVIEECLFAILVSEIEGQGIVTLEAAALGRPSLLTAVTGSRDLIPPTSTLPNGLTFGDVEELAGALEQWFIHPETVVDEGRQFFNYLRDLSNPEVIAQEYMKVYQLVGHS
jgi:glycosyltransferase involved in cell wall biosynthesis